MQNNSPILGCGSCWSRADNSSQDWSVFRMWKLQVWYLALMIPSTEPGVVPECCLGISSKPNTNKRGQSESTATLHAADADTNPASPMVSTEPGITKLKPNTKPKQLHAHKNLRTNKQTKTPNKHSYVKINLNSRACISLPLDLLSVWDYHHCEITINLSYDSLLCSRYLQMSSFPICKFRIQESGHCDNKKKTIPCSTPQTIFVPFRNLNQYCKSKNMMMGPER